MGELGFKKITPDNWLSPDKPSTTFVRFSPVSGKSEPIDGEGWVRAILNPSLVEAVPSEVQALYEVARGALVYGYFFYPLYTLAGEQLFRVVEAAVTYKCRTIGAPSSVKTFKSKVDYLINQKVIPKRERIAWDAARQLRNFASHPERQSIFPPGMVIGMLEDNTNMINSLFSS